MSCLHIILGSTYLPLLIQFLSFLSDLPMSHLKNKVKLLNIWNKYLYFSVNGENAI